MEFPKSVTIDACEKFLEKLAVSRQEETLLLPIGTSRYAFGGLASAIQAVNTWARHSENRFLSLRNSKAQIELEELIQRPHKFAAAMFAKSTGIADQPDFDIRPQINALAKSAIEHQALSPFGQQRGGLCWFAFVDHSSKGFDRNFYIEKSNLKPEPRQLDQFKAVIKAMVDKSMSAPGGAKPLESESQKYLGRIFYELFLNTHEHGTRSYPRTEWLKPGVRIIYTQGINLSDAGAQGALGKQPILATYLQAATQKHGMENQKRFIEIGIVDSGLGYCKRWLADRPSEEQENISIETEYTIFKKCFNFRQTSTNSENKGHGLPAVMDRLTKLDGFMRVRSGRLSLYRDFMESPYLPDDTCTFSDWTSKESAEKTLTPMSPVTGAAITLLIPLEAK